MQCTTLSRPLGVRVVPSSRRMAVRVRAGNDNNSSNPFAGLLRIFTPNSQIDTKEDWTGTGNGFSGKIKRGPKKPFSDGFEGKAKTTSGGKTTKGKKVEEEVEKKGNILDYLNQAAERVVRANFKGDDTEPDWKGMGSGDRGYSGDVRNKRDPKNRGPFHPK